MQAAREARTSIAQFALHVIAAARASPAAVKRLVQASPTTVVCTVKTIAQVLFWTICGIVHPRWLWFPPRCAASIEISQTGEPEWDAVVVAVGARYYRK